MNMDSKICSKCNLEKGLSNFHKWKYGTDGYKRECKECRKKETENYYDSHKHKIKFRVSQYRKNNPEKVKEIKQKIYEKDKQRILMVNKLYRENNREKRNEYNRLRKSNDPIFKLKHIMNSRIRIFLKSHNITKNNKTFEIVGCTPQKLKEHIESQFRDNMCWNNHGEWHIDHIIPISSAKTEEEIYKLSHYTNLQPLWGLDNIKKSNKLK